MKNFNILYTKLLEDMTTGSTFGAGQAHAPVTGQSSDFYAPGDARNIWGSAASKKRKKHRWDRWTVVTFLGPEQC